MNFPVNAYPSRVATRIVGLVLVIALAACGSHVNADPVNATAGESKAGTERGPTSASGPSDPLCGKATYAEVSRVAGGNFDKVDVIDKPDLDYVECVFLDSRDLYAGLTIRFVSTAKLVATSSKWQTAAAYFKEWSRGGKSVADVGERAAWIELPAGLLVLAGDQALQLSASKSDLTDPAVRAKFETLARAVVARIH
ncbi:MAG: hypothetical protein ABIO49_10600 [Dokdonella sp.]